MRLTIGALLILFVGASSGNQKTLELLDKEKSVILPSSTKKNETGSASRDGKFFSLFNIVTFQNTECMGSVNERKTSIHTCAWGGGIRGLLSFT